MLFSHQLSLLLLLCLLMASCINTTQDVSFYTLVSTAQKQIAAEIPQDISIGISQWDIPDYLDNVGIVNVLDREQDLYVSTDHYWAGDFEAGAVRTMAINMSRQLNHKRIWPSPWAHNLKPKYLVQVTLLQLNGPLGGEVRLLAKWLISTDKGQRELVVEDSDISVKAQDATYSGYVGAMNLALEQLAAEISLALASLLSG